MNARLDFMAEPSTGKVLKYLMSAGNALRSTTLPITTQELVSVRVSQINGCAACLDMHIKEALAAGEDPVRLGLVAAWPEATVFTDAERAALELAEKGTRLADAAHGVSDEVWANAAKHYDQQQLAALVLLVGFMNLATRINIITRQPGGDYPPGK
ncbi:carboxymuconolactone decarboxylase family protein [Actinacidiphila paucisporea]|uniref:Alkylhydroperoxidase AhpD family core domain-containing protein n=1 Tax=Actinacidiphila paucisporea TaxID=310782 RepID=A0A1M7QY87_9ACTN|nr:carboxymuconolactone decarboxylase family protein [Actinacidiphila paucisporea]SHN36782.1 alkylhydroperoxidase AhpD family core domain-containing protein [Actinacidiphila paucisporea]